MTPSLASLEEESRELDGSFTQVFSHSLSIYDVEFAWVDPEGGGGGQGSGAPAPKNHKHIGFLSITGPDPLKITKLQSQHSMLGHHRHASKTPFKWRFARVPMMAHLVWYLDPLSPHQLKKKDVVKFGPTLTNLSGSAHGLDRIARLPVRFACWICLPV